jgi:hypothetical protein
MDGVEFLVVLWKIIILSFLPEFGDELLIKILNNIVTSFSFVGRTIFSIAHPR